MNKLILSVLLVGTSMGVFAKPQTVTLNVPTMNCVTCPYTVKRALKGVDGVSHAEVTLKTKLAIVTFDDEKTNTAALIIST